MAERRRGPPIGPIPPVAARRMPRPSPDRPARTTTLVGPTGQVEISAHPAPDRKRARREEAQCLFVADHWASLAAAAHAGYREHGAGAVVVLAARPEKRTWLDHLDAAFRPWARRVEMETQSLWYATQLHTLPGAGDAWFSGWEARQVEEYDPRREAVVVLLDGPPVAFRVAGSPSPEAAYQRSRVGLN